MMHSSRRTRSTAHAAGRRADSLLFTSRDKRARWLAGFSVQLSFWLTSARTSVEMRNGYREQMESEDGVG